MQGKIEHVIDGGNSRLGLSASKDDKGLGWFVCFASDGRSCAADLDATQLMELARVCVQLANLSGVTRRLR